MEPITETKPTAPKPSFWKELISYAVIAVVIVVPIRMFVAQPFIVNGESMDTTFHDGQYLIVDELSYRFHEPNRGDVLIFKYPEDTSKYFIKRLIGLPGETVTVDNSTITIVNKEHPEGIKLDEPYVHSATFGSVTKTLSDDEYFVMGDNRLVSLDSRSWGALPKSDLVGTPILRLFPLNEFGFHPGSVSTTTAELNHR